MCICTTLQLNLTPDDLVLVLIPRIMVLYTIRKKNTRDITRKEKTQVKLKPSHTKLPSTRNNGVSLYKSYPSFTFFSGDWDIEL